MIYYNQIKLYKIIIIIQNNYNMKYNKKNNKYYNQITLYKIIKVFLLINKYKML